MASALMTGSRTGRPGRRSLAGPRDPPRKGGGRTGRLDYGVAGKGHLLLPLSRKSAVSGSCLGQPAPSEGRGSEPAEKPGDAGHLCSTLERPPVFKNSPALPQARPLTFLKFNCKRLSQQFHRLPGLAQTQRSRRTASGMRTRGVQGSRGVDLRPRVVLHKPGTGLKLRVAKGTSVSPCSATGGPAVQTLPLEEQKQCQQGPARPHPRGPDPTPV